MTAKAQMIAKEMKSTITNEIVISAIQKELKQLNQTIAAIPEETDLYESTVYKVGILEKYLPKQMSVEEVRAKVEKILSCGDYPNMGLKMKVVMNALKGKADNKTISDIVKEYK